MSSNSNTNGTNIPAKKKVVVVKKVAGPTSKVTGTAPSKLPVPSTTKTTTTNKSSQINATNSTNASTTLSSTDSNQKSATSSTKVTPQTSQLSNSSDPNDNSTKSKTTASKATAVPKATKATKKAQVATKVTQPAKSTPVSSTSQATASESKLAPPKASAIKPPTPRGTTSAAASTTTSKQEAPATKATTAVPKIDVTAAKTTLGIKPPTPRTISPRDASGATTPAKKSAATPKATTPAAKATTATPKAAPKATEATKKTTTPAATTSKVPSIAVPSSSAASGLKPPTPRGTTAATTSQSKTVKVVVAHKVPEPVKPTTSQAPTTPRKASEAPATPKPSSLPSPKSSGLTAPAKVSSTSATQPKVPSTPKAAEQPEKPASPESSRPLGSSIKRAAGPQRKAASKNLKANVEKISQNAGTMTRERDAFTTKYIGEAVGAMGLLAALGVPKRVDEDANTKAKSMIFIPANEVRLKASEEAETDKNTSKLIHIKGRRRIAVRQVECHHRSLNEGDSFILDAGQILYNWNGKAANKMEIAKAFDVAKRMNTKEKGSRAQVIVFNQRDGIDVATDHHYQKFWKLLAHEGPSNAMPQIADHSVAGVDEDIDKKDFKDKLYKISDNENYNPNGNPSPGKGKSPRPNDLFKIEAIQYDKLGQELLDPRYVFLLDCTKEFYIWSGKQSANNMRKWAQDKAKILFGKTERPSWTRVTKENDGAESILFKEKFWNFQDELPIMKKLELVSNVAAKREEKFDVNIMYNPPAHKPEQAIDDGHGMVKKMWRVDMNDKQEYPLDMSGHFFMEDSFIIWYQYKESEKQLYATSHSMSFRQKDKHILYFWQGRKSGIKKKGWSAVLTADLSLTAFDSGECMQLRIPQQMETIHFQSLFKGNIVVHKGSFVDYQQSYSDGVHMYEIRGRPNTDLRIIEVTPECKSLNTNDLFLVLRQGKFMAWLGKHCHIKDHTAITKIASCIYRSEEFPIEFVHEGHESEEFWDLLGGQAAYFTFVFKHIRLFHCHLGSGVFSADYIFDICQDELVEKDFMILDTSDIVFVWKGSKSTETKEKLTVELAVEYVMNDTRWNRESTPIYLVESGNEPYLFTGFFHGWDFAKTKSTPELESLHSARDLVKEFSRTYTLEELRQKPKGLDPQRYEYYLSDAEFFSVFDMGKDAYEQLPQWKKDIIRKKHGIY